MASSSITAPFPASGPGHYRTHPPFSGSITTAQIPPSSTPQSAPNANPPLSGQSTNMQPPQIPPGSQPQQQSQPSSQQSFTMSQPSSQTAGPSSYRQYTDMPQKAHNDPDMGIYTVCI